MSAREEAAPGPDILEWLDRASNPKTAVETLAAGDASERVAFAAKTIRYLREANQRHVSAESQTIHELRRQIEALQPSGRDR